MSTMQMMLSGAGRRGVGRWAVASLLLLVLAGLTGCSDGDAEGAAGANSASGANNPAGTNNPNSGSGTDVLFEVPQCNWIDDPSSCEGWRCYRDDRGQVCEQTRPDRPDGRGGWMCSDDANPGYTTCWREGEGDDDPSGGGGWTCRDDANGQQVCTQDDPGGFGDPDGGNGDQGDDSGGNGQWDCVYNAANRLECTRTDGPNGGPGWTCRDDARGSRCEGTISDDPGGNGGAPGVGSGDEPAGGGWVCVNDGDTRRCDNPHDDDTPGGAGDNPTGGPGWTCRQLDDARVCEFDDPSDPGVGDDPNGSGGVGPRDPRGGGYDTPDGGGGWRCVIESGVKTCASTDDPGGPGSNNGTGNDDPNGGGGSWDCRFDPDTGRTTCLSTPDTPTDEPGWECYESGEQRVCVNDDPDGPGGPDDPDGPGDPGDNNDGPGGPGVDDCGDPTGNVQGRVCTPSGEHWVVGATVTAQFTDCNGQLRVVTTQTDAEGYFILVGVPPGTYIVTVEKGPYRTQYTVTITAGQTTTIPLGDFCFDASTNIAVITGQYDQISRVLDDLGFTYDLYDGYPETNGTRQLLGDLSRMNGYDAIFMNCGSTIRGIFDDPTTRDLVRSNLEAYVEGGGHLYMSDWEYGYTELAFSDKIDFSGEDNARFDVLSGASGYRGATVTDAELAAVLGEDRVTLNFDYPAWAVVEAVAPDVRVFLRGDVELLRGGIKRNVPVLMSFGYGEGSVIYTSYHIHQNDAINDIFTFTVLSFQ